MTEHEKELRKALQEAWYAYYHAPTLESKWDARLMVFNLGVELHFLVEGSRFVMAESFDFSE